MTVYPEDVAIAKKWLWAEESVMVTCTQRMNPELGGSVINPTTVIATDKRLIIINRTTVGIRKDIESIPYNRISSVRFEAGLVSASVFIVVAGYVSPPGEQGFLKKGESEGEIGGLHKDDAKALSEFVNKMISGIVPTAPGMQQGQGQPAQRQGRGQGQPSGAYVYCSKCGAKNDMDANFCNSCGAPLNK